MAEDIVLHASSSCPHPQPPLNSFRQSSNIFCAHPSPLASRHGECGLLLPRISLASSSHSASREEEELPHRHGYREPYGGPGVGNPPPRRRAPNGKDALEVKKKGGVPRPMEIGGLPVLYDDGYGNESVKDCIDASGQFRKTDGGPPRWFCPVECGEPVKGSPVLFFLPGIDGVGMGLILHHRSLGKETVVVESEPCSTVNRVLAPSRKAATWSSKNSWNRW